MSPPSLSRVVAGSLVFLVLSTAGLFIVSREGRLVDFSLLSTFPATTFLLLIFMAGVDSVLGGLRFRIFFDGRALPHISLWRCMCSNWVNMLLAAVTPSQTGGGPAQLYALRQYGARVSEGVIVSLVTFTATLVCFLLAGILSLHLLPPELFTSGLMSTLKGCLTFVVVITALVLLVILFPGRGTALAGGILRPILAPFPRLARPAEKLLKKVESELTSSRRDVIRLVRQRPGTMPLLLATTVALFVNKYLMAFVIARALLATLPFETFLGLQVVQHLIVYYAPTPGAAGIASLSAAWIFGSVLSPAMLTTYVVLWRASTTVLGAVFGIPVLLSLMRGARPAAAPLSVRSPLLEDYS